MENVNQALLYLGTEDGLFVYRVDITDNHVQLVGRGLAGHAVRGIAVHPVNPNHAYIACGLRGHGLYFTKDAGQSFHSIEQFEEKWVWDVFINPHDHQHLFVGTEPPMLYESKNAGLSFEAFESINNLKSKSNWKFFHPPYYAGHVHGIQVDASNPKRILAGIEHGALIFTEDGGLSWQERLVGYDLHRIVQHPFKHNIMFAGAGEGLLKSIDYGQSWQMLPKMSGKYIHSVIIPHWGSDKIYVYVDSSVCPIYRSDDLGNSWIEIGNTLPAAQPADNLVVLENSTLLYSGDVKKGTSQLFISRDDGDKWEELALQLPKVWRMKAVKEGEIIR